VVNAVGQLGCETSPVSDISNQGSPILLEPLAQEHSQISQQQNEIDQLASELRSLRERVHAHR
jgi:hypothetical protein